MRKIFKFMLVASVCCSIAFVSCKKDESKKEDQKEQEDDKDKDKDKQGGDTEEPATLAIDGKFGEWADIAPVEGSDGILLTKSQSDDDKLYFYAEIDVESMVKEFAYSDYMHLYLDCGGDGANSVSYWGGESGSAYDALYEFWLVLNGVPGTPNWDANLSAKAKIENGVYKTEFSILRAANELFSSKTIKYGMALTDTFCDTSSGSEEWGGGELVGLAPAQDEDMAKVK